MYDTKLTQYARETANDNECDYYRACRMMDDDRAIVAADIGCTVADVADFCRRSEAESKAAEAS